MHSSDLNMLNEVFGKENVLVLDENSFKEPTVYTVMCFSSLSQAQLYGLFYSEEAAEVAKEKLKTNSNLSDFSVIPVNTIPNERT